MTDRLEVQLLMQESGKTSCVLSTQFKIHFLYRGFPKLGLYRDDILQIDQKKVTFAPKPQNPDLESYGAQNMLETS